MAHPGTCQLQSLIGLSIFLDGAASVRRSELSAIVPPGSVRHADANLEYECPADGMQSDEYRASAGNGSEPYLVAPPGMNLDADTHVKKIQHSMLEKIAP